MDSTHGNRVVVYLSFMKIMKLKKEIIIVPRFRLLIRHCFKDTLDFHFFSSITSFLSFSLFLIAQTICQNRGFIHVNRWRDIPEKRIFGCYFLFYRRKSGSWSVVYKGIPGNSFSVELRILKKNWILCWLFYRWKRTKRHKILFTWRYVTIL